MVSVISQFTIDCDIHRAHHCPWQNHEIDIPSVHAHVRLADHLVQKCGLDTGTLIITPNEDNLGLLFNIYLDGRAEWGLEVGPVFFWDRYYRDHSQEYVPIKHVPGSAWPYAEASVGLSEALDLEPHAGYSSAPPLIVRMRTVELTTVPG